MTLDEISRNGQRLDDEMRSAIAEIETSGSDDELTDAAKTFNLPESTLKYESDRKRFGLDQAPRLLAKLTERAASENKFGIASQWEMRSVRTRNLCNLQRQSVDNARHYCQQMLRDNTKSPFDRMLETLLVVENGASEDCRREVGAIVGLFPTSENIRYVVETRAPKVHAYALQQTPKSSVFPARIAAGQFRNCDDATGNFVTQLLRSLESSRY